MGHFTTKQGVLFYSYTMEVEECRKLDRFLEMLDRSGVGNIIEGTRPACSTGRPMINPHRLFAALLLGFATGSGSLRDVEECCRYDIRFMYILEGKQPSYATFCTFVNEVIRPSGQRIFALVTGQVMKELGLGLDECFVDGTKIEADANRYKFVWKPLAYHRKMSEKAWHLLDLLGLGCNDGREPLLSSAYLSTQLDILGKRIGRMEDGKEKKTLEAMAKNLAGYMLRACDYEEKERICGPDRNSYYKTDHDATAMCLKDDYYSGLGSSMHAAYQIQIAVCGGFICSYFLSQNRNDSHDFIPVVENFHSMHGFYPKRIGADAGYGSLENYRFCDCHGIEAYLKYQAWEGECSARRPALYELLGDGGIRCLGGRIGTVTTVMDRHPKKAGSVFFRVDGCTGCPFMPYCRQYMKEPIGDYKIFEVNREFMKFKQEARDLLLSLKGIEMRVNRSCQVEGAFGVLKQDMGYTRFRRTGMEGVTTEFMLTALGYNVRKYLNDSRRTGTWTAPKGTKPQEFKKPSAKRLANRANKTRKKQPNEIAKNGYKYK